MSGETLYLEWGGDLVLNQNGGLQLATGWDYTRQAILRSLLTNPQVALPNGSTVAADYIFDPSYGVGLPDQVDGVFNQQYLFDLEQRINLAVLADVDISSSVPPNITYSQPNPDTLLVWVRVLLATGLPGQVAFTIGD